MKQFIGYPKIEQFRNVCKSVEKDSQYKGWDEGKSEPIIDRNALKPVLTFEGTVKSHGTNGAVCFDTETGEYWIQSRKNIITPEKDNAGFSFWATSNIEEFKNIFKQIEEIYPPSLGDIITIFGEWSGGNIQKGVAISGLDKHFKLFDVSIGLNNENKTFLNKEQFNQLDVGDVLYHTKQFKTYSITIDFNEALKYIPKLVELTDEVEEECPIGKYFGRVKGEDCTIGEGIVWTYSKDDTRYVFKTKGEKHSNSKVKKIKITVSPEVLESIDKFVEYAVTLSRLEQAWGELEDKDIKQTGVFLKWMMSDICKEEMDVLKENNLEPSQIAKEVSHKSRLWLLNKLDSSL